MAGRVFLGLRMGGLNSVRQPIAPTVKKALHSSTTVRSDYAKLRDVDPRIHAWLIKSVQSAHPTPDDIPELVAASVKEAKPTDELLDHFKLHHIAFRGLAWGDHSTVTDLKKELVSIGYVPAVEGPFGELHHVEYFPPKGDTQGPKSGPYIFSSEKPVSKLSAAVQAVLLPIKGYLTQPETLKVWMDAEGVKTEADIKLPMTKAEFNTLKAGDNYTWWTSVNLLVTNMRRILQDKPVTLAVRNHDCIEVSDLGGCDTFNRLSEKAGLTINEVGGKVIQSVPYPEGSFDQSSTKSVELPVLTSDNKSVEFTAAYVEAAVHPPIGQKFKGFSNAAPLFVSTDLNTQTLRETIMRWLFGGVK